jgi:hypothetical protein
MRSHRENEIACVDARSKRMQNGKKKSSGWRPPDKRRTPAEHQARYFARQAATAQHDSDRIGRWRACPVRHCRRVGRCDSEELQCQRRPRTATAHRNAAPKASNAAAAPQRPAMPVMSAAEAAAAIKASIAAMPPDPFNRDDLEALIRDGRV